ncbi:gem-associated protein 5 [Solea senegalensis]|uniref:Gem-associated protein 5 n=1 Tax=Solea senegalensis TaxID=28829 RepID=A0AAV6SID0_SOLSE|nr:gem-associated protein 5 [Solea senegalensis]
MFERSLPASPNWYCSRCSDVSSSGLMGFGAKNNIYLIDVSACSCRVVGELVGHRDVVSGFSFCHHEGQGHLCVSSAHDGTICFWDTNTRTPLRELASHQSPVSAVHWSPVDKNLVVSGDEKGVVMCHWYHTGDTGSFFPEPRTIFCLSCSPHTWSCVAVGYKDGMIVLIDVSKKGEVTHRLRGHDDEIHSLAWAPLPGESALCCRPEDSEVTNGVLSEEDGGLLASGSKDQTVRIWSAAKGKGVMTLKLPYLKRRGSALDPGVKERLWLSVLWPRGRSNQLVSSCFSGELVVWDLTRSGKQRWTLLGTSSDGQNHSRIVFNMSSVLQDDRELLISTSMDREIKCWDLSSLDCCWTLPTLGGFVYKLAFSPVGAGCLALGVGDNMIRVWNTLTTQNQYDTRSFWQGIKSKVTALAWHPKKEGSLAFGTDDGKVGIYDVFSNKPPQVSSSYHRRTVYTLAWGPPVPPMTSVAGKACHSLYSCGGEGVILQHDPARLSGDASDVDSLIRDSNNIRHKLSPHTDLSWKPDGKVVAIGNEDGCVDVYVAPPLKLLCSVQQHHKIINTLRWHHDLLASGSSNAVVYVHDLRAVIENPPDSPPVLTEPYRRLCGHTAKITDMAWSPHHDARLVTVSYDGTAQVWDVLQEATVANYRGHTGYLLCVDWSPVDPDLVWTGGKDFTVQEWSISKQEFTKPPTGKKLVELKEKMKQKKKNKKKPTSAGGAMVSAGGAMASPQVNGEKVTNEEKASTGQEASGDEDEVGSVSSTTPAAALFETQKKSSSSSSSVAAKIKDRTDLMMKRKKPRSLLPLSSSMDQRPREDQLQDCVSLSTCLSTLRRHDADGQTPPPGGCVPGEGRHLNLGLYCDRAALHRLLHSEEDAHLEACHFDSVVYLRLWSGDLQGALQLATERGELNDHLLSLAPMAGFSAWQRAVQAFVQQLCLQDQHLKAASHLLSINQVHEAVELLLTHRLYREAATLALARLQVDDLALRRVYSSWASSLEKDGHFSSAAKCYLAAGAVFDAAKVIARKNDVASLRAAADVARIGGELALARALALRCSKELAAAQDWVAAQEVVMCHGGLKVHQLHLSVCELAAAALEDAAAVSPSCISRHSWASPAGGHASLLDRVRDVWEEQFAISERSTGSHGAAALLQELRSMESPTASTHASVAQVLLMSSLHLTAAALCWLLDDDAQLVMCLWRAVTSLTDAGNFSVSAGICRRLFPHGDVSAFSTKRPKTLHLTDDAAHARDSLHAAILFHRLYEHWWTHETTDDKGGKARDVPRLQDGGVWSGDLALLVCERHAALQDSRRRVSEIQEQLSAMVTQHRHAHASEGQEDSGKRSDETFLSLSVKMSTIQRTEDGLEDDVKVTSHTHTHTDTHTETHKHTHLCLLPLRSFLVLTSSSVVSSSFTSPDLQRLSPSLCRNEPKSCCENTHALPSP